MFKHSFLARTAPAVAVLALFLGSATSWAQHRGGHHAAFRPPARAAFHHSTYRPAVTHAYAHRAYVHPYAHGWRHNGYPYWHHNGYRYPYRYGWHHHGYPYRYGGWYGGLWGYPYGTVNYTYPYYAYSVSSTAYPDASAFTSVYPTEAAYAVAPYDSSLIGAGGVLSGAATVGPSPAATADAAAAATLRVVMPAYGTVSIDNYKTEQREGAREFATPPLPVGQEFTYRVTARFMQYGMDVSRTKDVLVHAGDRVTVDFSQSNR